MGVHLHPLHLLGYAYALVYRPRRSSTQSSLKHDHTHCVTVLHM